MKKNILHILTKRYNDYHNKTGTYPKELRVTKEEYDNYEYCIEPLARGVRKINNMNHGTLFKTVPLRIK